MKSDFEESIIKVLGDTAIFPFFALRLLEPLHEYVPGTIKVIA